MNVTDFCEGSRKSNLELSHGGKNITISWHQKAGLRYLIQYENPKANVINITGM